MKSVIFFVLLSVVAISMAATLSKRETKAKTRPEAPLTQDCVEPGENRENCFLTDPTNLEIYNEYLDEVKVWEKENPTEAATYNEKNPTVKKQEQETLAELEKFAKIHES